MQIAFDLDGTLIDSAPGLHAATARTLARINHPAPSLGTIRGFIGNGLPKLVARVARASGLPPGDVAGLLAAFRAEYDADPVGPTTVFPGVADCLAELAVEGHSLSICTNKPEGPTRQILAHFGLADWFEVVIGGDSLDVHKPDPTALHAAYADPAGPRAFVGDSEVDGETAAAAGVPFLLYSEGYRRGAASDIPQHARFSDWRALPGLVADFVQGA